MQRLTSRLSLFIRSLCFLAPLGDQFVYKRPFRCDLRVHAPELPCQLACRNQANDSFFIHCGNEPITRLQIESLPKAEWKQEAAACTDDD